MIVKTIFEKEGRWSLQDLRKIGYLSGITLANFDNRQFVQTSSTENYLCYKVRLPDVQKFAILVNISSKFVEETGLQVDYLVLQEIITLYYYLTSKSKTMLEGFSEPVTPNYTLSIASDVREIMAKFKISPNIVERITGSGIICPLVLYKLNNHSLAYIIIQINNDNAKIYAGIQNACLESEKYLNRTLLPGFECFFEKPEVIYIFQGKEHFYLAGKPAYESAPANTPAMLFRALIGQFPCTVYTGPNAQSDNLAYYLYVDTIKSNHLALLYAIQRAYQFPKIVETLMPDSLIQKIKNREPITDEEANNIAKFLTLAAAVLDDNFYVMITELDGRDLVTKVYLDSMFKTFPSTELNEQLWELVKKDPGFGIGGKFGSLLFSNGQTLFVKYYKGKLYVVGKSIARHWWTTIDGFDFTSVKSKLLNSYLKGGNNGS